MNGSRFSTSADHIQIESLFKKVRDNVRPQALFHWSDEQIHEELKKSHFYLSVADEGLVQGFIAHRVNEDFVEIMALGTDPLLKQKGLMFSLLKDFVQKFGNQGLSVTLEVHERNSAAISLYFKCGFKQIHQRSSYYKDGGAALVMTFSS